LLSSAIAAVIIVILLEELESLASSAPDRARAGSEGGAAERTRARGKVLDDVEPEPEPGAELEVEAGGGVPGRSQGSSFMPSW
jgi:hypothetical protein